ncbi:MAG: PaaI family thioesterase [Lautropia sp.]
MSQGARPGNLPVRIPYIESLGVVLDEMADGRAKATMLPKPEHMNSWGVVHGGIVMTLLDFTMAMAGRSAYPDSDPSDGRNLTIEMKTSFLRPGKGRLTISAQCVQAGRSLAFCEGEVIGEDGQPAARATGTYKFLRG